MATSSPLNLSSPEPKNEEQNADLLPSPPSSPTSPSTMLDDSSIPNANLNPSISTSINGPNDSTQIATQPLLHETPAPSSNASAPAKSEQSTTISMRPSPSPAPQGTQSQPRRSLFSNLLPSISSPTPPSQQATPNPIAIRPKQSRDYLRVSRENLLAVLRHLVREVVERSILSGGLVTDEDDVDQVSSSLKTSNEGNKLRSESELSLSQLLGQLFIVLDHLFLHGLKYFPPRKPASSGFFGSLLGGSSATAAGSPALSVPFPAGSGSVPMSAVDQVTEVPFDPYAHLSAWPLIERLLFVAPLLPQLHDIVGSIRSFSEIRTGRGQLRVWIRLSLMQKHFGDYMRALIDRGESLLSEFYEEGAALRHEESGALIAGQLLALHVLDYQFCMRPSGTSAPIQGKHPLDGPIAEINFVTFMRSISDDRRVSPSTPSSPNTTEQTLSQLLDQKAYLEEINRSLRQQISDLQIKKMRSDSEFSSSSSERAVIVNEKPAATEATPSVIPASATLSLPPVLVTPQATKLASQVQQAQTGTPGTRVKADGNALEFLYASAEARLTAEIKRREELESKMREMEARALQWTREGQEHDELLGLLRSELDHVKQLGLTLATQVQERELELQNARSELVGRDDKINALETKSSDLEQQLKRAQQRFLAQRMDEARQRFPDSNGEDEVERLRTQVTELESALEQMGEKLSSYELELSSLRERDERASIGSFGSLSVGSVLPPTSTTPVPAANMVGAGSPPVSGSPRPVLVTGGWVDENAVSACQHCRRQFTLTRRKHHCRLCGGVFCSDCTDHKLTIPTMGDKPQRICERCYNTQRD